MIRKQCGFWIPVLSVITALLMLFPGVTAQAGEDDLPLPIVAKAPGDIFLYPGESKPVTITFNYDIVGTTDTDNRPGHTISADGIELYGNASIRMVDKDGGINQMRKDSQFGAKAGVERTPYYFNYEPFYAGTTVRYAVSYGVGINGKNYDGQSYFNVTYAPYEEDISVVVGGVTLTVNTFYDYDGQYIVFPGHAEFNYISGGEYAVGLSWGIHPSIFMDADLTTVYGPEPETGKDYYFRCGVSNPVVNNHVYDFSQLKPENCSCSIDGYTAKCVKIIVNPIEEGKNDRADLVFRIRKKGKEIDSVRVTGVTEPTPGKQPVYDAQMPADADYELENYDSGNWHNGICWEDVTDNKTLSKDDIFRTHHTYRIIISLVGKNDFIFTEDDVSAAVNGQEAESVIRYSARNIGLTATYKCKADMVVSVTGVTVPSPGEKPVYEAQLSEWARYELENYDSGGWHNGICWEDVTDNKTLDKDDVFVSGHTYRITVSLVGKDDFIFPENEVIADVNGKIAESVRYYNTWNIGVTAHFKCEGKTVHAVYLGIESPEAGESPDWNVTVTEPGAHYAIDNYTSTYWKNGVIWHDMTADKDMGEGDKFAAGHQYRVTVSVVTKDGYVFGNYQDGEVEAYLGDEKADEIDAWNDPENNIGLIRTYTVTAERLAGDANEDGKVDMRDALTVVQYVKGKTGAINLKNADVTGDGKAAIEDARLIGQWAAGWNVGLK